MKTLSLNKQPATGKTKPHALDRFAGQRCVLQIGPVTYQGKLTITDSWLVMQDCTVTGNRRVAVVTEVCVNRHAVVAHAHLENAVTSLEATHAPA